MTNNILCLLLYMTFWISNLSSQDISSHRFINFGAQDGLEEKYVYSVSEDKSGYIWIGTGSGLYRYDGVSFKYYKSNINKPGRTISNVLQAVFTDADGRIWLGSLNDLQWYEPGRNKFWRPDEQNATVQKVLDAYILNFFQDSKNNIWICTGSDYFFKFNPKDSSFTHFASIYPSSASKNVLKIIEGKNGSYYSVHSEGIYEFNTDVQLINFFPFPGNQITNSWYDKHANLILLTTLQKGILNFDINKGKFQKYSPGENKLLADHLFCLTKDANGNTWVGSYPLFKIDSHSKKIERIIPDYTSYYGFKTSKIGFIYPDRKGNIWICSYNGFSMIPWQNQQVNSYELIEPASKLSIEPLGIYDLPGLDCLLIPNSSTNGLVVFDPVLNRLEVVDNPVASEKKKKKPITALIKNKNNQVYASDGEHFFQYLPALKKLIPIQLQDQNQNPIKGIGMKLYDHQGIVYIAKKRDGFYQWNTITGKLTHINRWDIDPSYQNKSENTMIPCLADSKGNVWFTSNPGIYRYNPKKQEWAYFANKIPNGLPPISTNFMEEDANGHIWITNITNGLYEFYMEDGKEVLKNYNMGSQIGLATDYLLNIHKDLYSNILWIASTSGLHRFDPVEKRVLSVINTQYGLSENDMRYGFSISSNNIMYALFYGKLSILDLNKYRFNKDIPNVLFNSVKVQDKEMIYNLDGKKLFLNYRENFLSFEFASLNFNNSKQNNYYYKLDEVNKDWVFNEKRNFVSFSGLQPGNYVFRVKAMNNDGQWSDSESVINFVIQPIFYNTWWFRILVLSIIAAGVVMFYRYRVRTIKKQERLQQDFNQQLTNMEMRALRAQMNPHFIFNSLNSIQKYILKNEHFAASQYLTKFSRLIRLILDHSDQNFIPISSELKLLNLYIEIESLRFDDAFDYTIKVDPELPLETIDIPSMLVQPYVENAIWHGLLHKKSRGNLSIEFKKISPLSLEIIIEDDGIGREKANELKSKHLLKKKSYGMQITEDRISLINRSNHIHASCAIYDLKKGEQAIGTRVVLNIPVRGKTAPFTGHKNTLLDT